MATIDELRARAELIAEEQQIGGNTAERVGDAFDMVADIIEAVAPGDQQAVLYNPQSPNEAQKAQARANIGAQETISDIADFVKVSAQTFTAAQKQQARENIGAEQAGGAVKNLAGSASDTETLIKAANNPNLQANVHLSGNNLYVNGIAGGIDLDNNGVNLKAGNSGYPNAKVKVNGQEVATKLYVDGKIDDRADPIEVALATIEAVIPSQASAQNQLADKAFVNSSISSSTANFVGTFDSLADLQAVQGATNNDYGFVIETDAVGNEYYDRYKYNGRAWLFEYKVESTPFTAAQWAAIQSGITAALVTKLVALPTNAELTTALNGKQATLVSGTNIATINGNNLLNGGNIVIEGGGGGSADAVLYTEQTLADGQKAQARTNIGAYAKPSGGIPETDLDDDVQTSLMNVVVNAQAIGELEAAYAALTQSDIVVVADHTAVATPAANTIYREPGATSYADWMYYGGAWVKMAEYSNAIDDVPTEGSANLVKSGGVFDKVKALGDYYIDAHQVQANTGVYVKASGSIGTSSSSTMTVAFYDIPSNVYIDKVSADIPKTGSTSSAIVCWASNLSATKVNVLASPGTTNAWSGEVNLPLQASYIVICYNASAGLPTVKFHTPDVGVEELSKPFNLTYTYGDCEFYNVVKSNGTISTESGYKCTDFIELYNAQLCIATTTTANSSVNAVLFYDENHIYISSIASVVQTSAKYAVPSNAKYIRLNCKNGDEYTFSSFGIEGFRNRLSYIGEPKFPKSLKILHFGNSFTANSTSNIDDILTAIGVGNVHVNYSNVGSASLSYWCDCIDNNTSCSITSATGLKLSQNGSMGSVIAHEWDIIVFQQVSDDSGNYITYIPYLAKLIAFARQHCTNKNVKIAFNFTWGTNSVDYSSVKDAVLTMRDKFGEQIDYIIPVGTAIENIRNTSIATNANRFLRDVKHLAVGVGEYVASCTYYCTLIQPFTGVPITADTTTTITTSGGLGEVDVTVENRALCQACAVYAAIYKWAALDVESL